jgi:hypothetical protein
VYGGEEPRSEGATSKHADGYGTVTSDELQSTFNPYVKFKQLLVCNELSIDDKKRMANKLKDITVRTSVTINEKGVRQYTVRDRVNYFITSNEDRPVHLNDGDRRFFIHRVTSKQLPAEKFAAFVRWRDHDGGGAALLHYLMHEVDLGDFNPHGAPPMTDAKQEVIDLGRTGVDAWVSSLKADPDEALPLPQFGADLWTVHDLCARYNDAHKHRPIEVGALTSALKKAGIPDVASGYKTNKALTVSGARSRMVAVRNVEQYVGMAMKQAQDLHDKQHGKKFSLQRVRTEPKPEPKPKSKFAAKKSNTAAASARPN